MSLPADLLSEVETGLCSASTSPGSEDLVQMHTHDSLIIS